MATKIKSHCTIRNQKLFCTHCGGEQVIPYPILPDIFSAMATAFEKVHKNCKSVWKQPEPDMSKTEEERANWWWEHGERGASSETIFKFISNRCIDNSKIFHPHDPDDFRRCYMLLKAIPEWRAKLDCMKQISPVWSKLVDNWDKLTEMLETAMKNNSSVEEMYNLMESLGC